MGISKESAERWEAQARKYGSDDVLWWAGENNDGSGLMFLGSVVDATVDPAGHEPDTWQIMVTNEGGMWLLGIYAPNGWQVACHPEVASDGISRHLTVFDALAETATEHCHRLIYAIREGEPLPDGWTLQAA